MSEDTSKTAGVWNCSGCDKPIAGYKEPVLCAACKSKNIQPPGDGAIEELLNEVEHNAGCMSSTRLRRHTIQQVKTLRTATQRLQGDTSDMFDLLESTNDAYEKLQIERDTLRTLCEGCDRILSDICALAEKSQNQLEQETFYTCAEMLETVITPEARAELGEIVIVEKDGLKVFTTPEIPGHLVVEIKGTPLEEAGDVFCSSRNIILTDPRGFLPAHFEGTGRDPNTLLHLLKGLPEEAFSTPFNDFPLVDISGCPNCWRVVPVACTPYGNHCEECWNFMAGREDEEK